MKNFWKIMKATLGLVFAFSGILLLLIFWDAGRVSNQTMEEAQAQMLFLFLGLPLLLGGAKLLMPNK